MYVKFHRPAERVEDTFINCESKLRVKNNGKIWTSQRTQSLNIIL
jgi:hypothetical protein